MRSMSLATALVLAVVTGPAGAEVKWNELEQIFARSASEEPDGIHRFSFPRGDLSVTVDGVKLETGLALGSWLAFRPADGDQVTVTGDLVLAQDEVNPVMRRLAEGGIEVTGLHNHLLRADPFPMYLHVKGHGDAVELANRLSDALGLTGMPTERSEHVSGEPELTLDTTAITQALGYEGKADGGVYKIGIPRAGQITADGMAVPPSMGTAVAINFQSAGEGRAATTGDFVLTAEEVNPVIQALREHGIEVTALHNHMLEDEPRLFFMHFWGVGAPEDLTGGLKAALAEVDVEEG